MKPEELFPSWAKLAEDRRRHAHEPFYAWQGEDSFAFTLLLSDCRALAELLGEPEKWFPSLAKLEKYRKIGMNFDVIVEDFESEMYRVLARFRPEKKEAGGPC